MKAYIWWKTVWQTETVKKLIDGKQKLVNTAVQFPCQTHALPRMGLTQVPAQQRLPRSKSYITKLSCKSVEWWLSVCGGVPLVWRPTGVSSWSFLCCTRLRYSISSPRVGLSLTVMLTTLRYTLVYRCRLGRQQASRALPSTGRPSGTVSTSTWQVIGGVQASSENILVWTLAIIDWRCCDC